MAMTLTDILERRLRLALTTPCRGADAVEPAAAVAAPLLGWNEAARKKHLAHYLAQLDATKI
jgi:glycerol-3-phosphate dehydrogenase